MLDIVQMKKRIRPRKQLSQDQIAGWVDGSCRSLYRTFFLESFGVILSANIIPKRMLRIYAVMISIIVLSVDNHWLKMECRKLVPYLNSLFMPSCWKPCKRLTNRNPPSQCSCISFTCFKEMSWLHQNYSKL